jgi:hypothetical protein
MADILFSQLYKQRLLISEEYIILSTVEHPYITSLLFDKFQLVINHYQAFP